MDRKGKIRLKWARKQVYLFNLPLSLCCKYALDGWFFNFERFLTLERKLLLLHSGVSCFRKKQKGIILCVSDNVDKIPGSACTNKFLKYPIRDISWHSQIKMQHFLCSYDQHTFALCVNIWVFINIRYIVHKVVVQRIKLREDTMVTKMIMMMMICNIGNKLCFWVCGTKEARKQINKTKVGWIVS